MATHETIAQRGFAACGRRQLIEESSNSDHGTSFSEATRPISAGVNHTLRKTSSDVMSIPKVCGHGHLSEPVDHELYLTISRQEFNTTKEPETGRRSREQGRRMRD
jgi:hypothetical protein